ncbi:MAG: hypothetical protein O9333_04970 [Beijerinckiaceae bacterium]|jgi:hypothetical protein|nr:hypothetical protein [Beijerinckiaceae bacterium]
MTVRLFNITAVNTGTVIQTRGAGKVVIDGLRVQNSGTVLDTDNEADIRAKNIYAENVKYVLKANCKIPSELAEAIGKDVSEGRNATEIGEKYSDRLKGHGIDYDQIFDWVDRAAKGLDLISAIARLFGA